jgi:hypothetical protein
VSSQLFWRAAGVQLLLVAIVFGVLVALPLGDDFFDDYGLIVGPVAWVLCSLGTGRILSLPLDLTLFAAAAGGVAGTLVGLVASHVLGLLAGVAVFGASCAGYEAAREGPPDERRERDSTPV